MKLRWIAVFLILLVAAWLPMVAHLSATPPPMTQPDQAAAACCRGKNGSAMPCSPSKDAKDMPCCYKDAQDQQAAPTCCGLKAGKDCCTKNAHSASANCYKGKDAKLCAKKNGKDCCNAVDGRDCCHKNSTTAINAKPNAKSCCDNKHHYYCHG